MFFQRKKVLKQVRELTKLSSINFKDKFSEDILNLCKKENISFEFFLKTKNKEIFSLMFDYLSTLTYVHKINEEKYLIELNSSMYEFSFFKNNHKGNEVYFKINVRYSDIFDNQKELINLSELVSRETKHGELILKNVKLSGEDNIFDRFNLFFAIVFK